MHNAHIYDNKLCSYFSIIITISILIKICFIVRACPLCIKQMSSKQIVYDELFCTYFSIVSSSLLRNTLHPMCTAHRFWNMVFLTLSTDIIHLILKWGLKPRFQKTRGLRNS